MSEIEIFRFKATGHQVRIVIIEGQPWFVAADVCAALGISNARQAVSYLDDDEVRQVPVTTNDGSGRALPTNLVNEPGLYSLILRSRKPEAREAAALLGFTTGLGEFGELANAWRDLIRARRAREVAPDAR